MNQEQTEAEAAQKQRLIMFILINSDEDFFMGCYSTLELAKSAYARGVANKVFREINPPRCSIEEVPVDNVELISFFGGYPTHSRWELGPSGEWIKIECEQTNQ